MSTLRTISLHVFRFFAVPISLAGVACGGPDFMSALQSNGDAGDDRDNTPIFLPDPRSADPDATAEAGDGGGDAPGDPIRGGDAILEAGKDATLEGGANGDAGNARIGIDSPTADSATDQDTPGISDAGATLDSGTDGLACTNACPLGASQCAAGGVQTCQVQSNGCSQWVFTTTCGARQVCTATGGTPSCVCNATACTQPGTSCQDAQTVATCAEDINACFYVVSTSRCTAPASCSGLAPTAGCALACASSCMQGQTSCVSGGLATCTLGTNGCWAYGAPVACGTRQRCTAGGGSAACTCNADPVCATAGNVCAISSTLANCAQDTQGCFYEASSSPCTTPGAVCTGGRCQCPSGTTVCGTACVDMTKDPNNCGACARGCFRGPSEVGQCVASTCQPFVLQTIGPLTPPLLIDSNAAALYATLSGTAAVSIDTQTGSVLQSATGIFTSSNGGGLFSEDSTTLYGLDPTNAATPVVGITKSSMMAFTVPFKTMGGAIWVGAVPGSPEQICVYNGDPDYSLQCGGGGLSASRVVCDNGPDSVCPGSNQFVADATGLVWVGAAESGLPNSGFVMDTPNFVNPTIATLPGNTRPSQLVLDPYYVYWFDSGGSGLFYQTARSASSTVINTPLSSAAITHIPAQLAVDSSYLYWTDTTLGSISRVSIGAAMPTAPAVIANNQVGPTGIAVDANAIYWINGTGNTLMKMRKPQ